MSVVLLVIIVVIVNLKHQYTVNKHFLEFISTIVPLLQLKMDIQHDSWIKLLVNSLIKVSKNGSPLL